MTISALPPYKPDGTLPPIPEYPVDGEYLRRRYRISKAAFHNRKNALPSVKGMREGKRVLFSPDEVYIFDAMDFYVDKGFTLEEVAAAQKVFESAIETEEGDEEEFQRIEAPTQGQLALSPQADKFGREMAAIIAKAVEQLAPQPPKDPLKTLRLLKEAAEEDYVLTTRMLADVLGFSPETIHGFKSPEHRHGFELTKVAAGKWTVRRLKKSELKGA